MNDTAPHLAGWHSWHLHLPSGARSMHDRVITDVVGPVAAELAPRGYFFMRYWQRGPHVRVRFQGLSPQDAARVQAALAGRLPAAIVPRDGESMLDAAAFGAQSASLAAAGEGGRSLPVEAVLPPGVHSAVYEPELDRYGGADLMPLSERLFRSSSDAVLAILGDGPGLWERAQLAATATALIALSLGHPAATRTYCGGAAAFWRGYCNRLGFPAALVAQAERAGRQQGERWAAAPEQIRLPGEAGPTGDWARQVTAAVSTWRDALPLPAGRATAMSVLTSHVHMFHNRLGLTAREELFSYLGLSHLLDREPSWTVPDMAATSQ
jgi:thiopeptide-type bacteriocin biosynthesis protein